MRLYPFLAICLVEFNVCFVSRLNASRHEDHSRESLSGRANESNIIMEAELHHSARPKKVTTDIEDKSKEERVNFSDILRMLHDIVTPSWDPVTAFKVGVVSKKLEDNVEFFQWLNTLAQFSKDKRNFDGKAFIRSIEKMLESTEDQLSWYAWLLEIPQVKDEAAKKMMELASTNDKKRVFKALAKLDVRPDNLFRAMELRNMLNPGGAPTINRSFQWWFEYIQTFRSVSTASRTFNDEELLSLLVEEMEMMNREVKGAMLVHEHLSGLKSIQKSTSLLYQVVTLFESLRHNPKLKGFADSTLTFMVLKPSFEQLVLESWSKFQHTPMTIFHILRLGENFSQANYASLFTVWLHYINLYCKDVAPEGNYVLYAHLLSPTILNSDVKTFFQSLKFVKMLDGIRRSNVMKGISELLTILKVPRQVNEWLDSGMTPEKVLQLTMKLSPKAPAIERTDKGQTITKHIGLHDVDFELWLSFVVSYKQKHKWFTENDVLELLRPSMSNKELWMLFKSARKVPSLNELAYEMLKCLFLKIGPITQAS